MSDDFCALHGYDHMTFQFGNPIPYCSACYLEQQEKNRREGRPNTPHDEEGKKIAEDWYTWGFQGGINAERKCSIRRDSEFREFREAAADQILGLQMQLKELTGQMETVWCAWCGGTCECEKP